MPRASTLREIASKMAVKIKTISSQEAAGQTVKGRASFSNSVYVKEPGRVRVENWHEAVKGKIYMRYVLKEVGVWL